MTGMLRRALGRQGTLPPEARPCLLLGERCSGKTSLLLAVALRASAEEGRGAVFIARNPLQRLPGGARDPLSLKKIQFVYPRSREELVTFVAAMHETKSCPSLILLDGLDDYLDISSGQKMVAHLSALLVDTAAYFTEKLSPTFKSPDNASCHLIVSMTFPSDATKETEELPALSVIDRYFPERCCLERDMHCPAADAQPEKEKRYYRVRFHDGQEPKASTNLSDSDEWRLGIWPDGSLKVSLEPLQDQLKDQCQNVAERSLD